jgi:hypothetical protein
MYLHQDAKTRHLQLVAFLQKRRQGVGEQIANPACFFMGWVLFSAKIEEVFSVQNKY